jgi:hypothetical protein
MSTYIIAPTGADIMHFGKGHDDNPPGRGSGRYPWGSGKDPKASARRKRVADELFTANVKGGKDKPNISRAEQSLRESKKITDSVSNIVKRYGYTNEDLSNMTNQELQSAITRMNLENQYINLTSSKPQNTANKIADALDTVGDVLAIGTSAAVLVSVIKHLKSI